MNNKKHANPGGTTRDVNAAQRVALAIKLRASKVSYDEIARQCGYADKGSAHKAVQRELQRVVIGNVDELRQEEGLTLDLMQTECMKLFLDKDNKARLFAADRILAILERRAKLFGLDVRPDEIAGPSVIVREIPVGYLAVEATKEAQS